MTTQTITLPREVVEQAIDSLGSFVSDHGWAQSDMDTMDTLISALTEHVQPAQGEYASVAKELARLADIMRDCGRLVSQSGNAERAMRKAAAILQSNAEPAQGELQQVIEALNRACRGGLDCTCTLHRAAALLQSNAALTEQVQPAQGELEALLEKYWELAYTEGKSGASHGSEANEILHKMRAILQSNAELVPLTDEQIEEAAERVEAFDPADSFWKEFARAIEAEIKKGQQ